jgi:tRNA (guanosine-2'-O-)-methyltransferase
METLESMVGYFESYLTDHKRTLFNRVLQERTSHITVVLEDLFHPHNASAVLRNCECFGIQDVHIIENNHHFKHSRDIDRGSYKWLTLQRYNDLSKDKELSFKQLKKQGYQLIALSPKADEISLQELKIENPIALIFGAEKMGLSAQAQEHADQFVRIPMVGFTESFNVSVSVAIALYELTHRLKNSSVSWSLSEERKLHIRMLWALRTIQSPRSIVRHYLEQNPSAASLFDFSEYR